MRLLPPDPCTPEALWDLLEHGFSEMGSADHDGDIFLGFDLPWLRRDGHEASVDLHHLDGGLAAVSSGI